MAVNIRQLTYRPKMQQRKITQVQLNDKNKTKQAQNVQYLNIILKQLDF